MAGKKRCAGQPARGTNDWSCLLFMSGLTRSLLTYPSPTTLLFDALASLDALMEVG
jgi:hypothetical protein